MALNIKQTHAIVFGSKSTIKQFKELDIPKITINSSGDYIPFIDQITSLGIELDSTLSWRPQIKEVTKKVNRVIYGLRMITPCTSQSLRQRLVESLVTPLLDYCSVGYSDISCQLSEQLQRLSNRKHIIITPYRRRLNWMRVPMPADYFAALIMNRIVRMKQPQFLLPLFIYLIKMIVDLAKILNYSWP